MHFRSPVTLAGLLLYAGVSALAQNQPRLMRAPTLADLVYGSYTRNVLDLWQAPSNGPAPLVIFIHGGGFRQGDKRQISPALLENCLSNGISVAAINYRYSTQAPYPAPMMDSARAVQFLRLHAAEWNLDPKRFGATGGSAGAGISLWLAFHDNLANPRSSDPLERQSTRLSAVAVANAQTTYDPRAIAKLIGSETARIEPLRLLFGIREGDPLLARRAFPLYEEASPVTHLTADDPPVLLQYARPDTPLPPADTGIGIHHPRFGYFLKEKMDPLGIECVVRVEDNDVGNLFTFLRRHLVK